MKKLLYLVSAVALTLTSCSSEDDSNNNSSDVTLIKKIILTSDDEEDDSYWNNTIIFTYNGTKLVESREDDNYKTVYTYTGDLITKIEYFDGTVLDEYDLFSYNSSGKLIEYRSIGNDFEEKFTYTYNSDGTVSVNEYQGTIGSPTLVPSSPYTYTFTNNELTADDDSIFVYEDKNNPFMNVTGFKELMLPEFADDYMIAFGRNKMMTSTYDESNTSEGIFATHTYNSSNFPTSSVINANFTLGSFIGTVNVQYFYN